MVHQVKFRAPQDVRDWLQAQAERNSSSQASEIIRAIRERMERTAPQEGRADA